MSLTSNGELISDFLGLIELGADRTAHTIPDFEEADSDNWTDKLVAVCTNGASVYNGVYNGIVPQYKQLAAAGGTLVDFLCTAHTLENCAKSTDQLCITLIQFIAL